MRSCTNIIYILHYIYHLQSNVIVNRHVFALHYHHTVTCLLWAMTSYILSVIIDVMSLHVTCHQGTNWTVRTMIL